MPATIEVAYYYNIVDETVYNNVKTACQGLDINHLPGEITGNATIDLCNEKLGILQVKLAVVDLYYIYGKCPLVNQNSFPEAYL